MSPRATHARRAAATPRGSGLVDLMVGVVIALVAIAAAFRVLVAAEATRRVAQSDADAEQSAQFVMARMAFDVANAGAGIAPAAGALASCPVTADFTAITRPVAVVITDGGSANSPDSLTVRYAQASATAVPAYLAAPAPSGADFLLRSSAGIAPGDRLVVADRRGVCTQTTATAVSSPTGGVTRVRHDIVAADLPGDALVVNLGPAPRVVAVRYDVAGGSLRSTDLAGGDAPNPLASGILNLKVQYGLDTDGDGALDTWTSAVGSAAGDWTSTALLRADARTLGRVKAVRVGLIVRGDFAERGATPAFDWVMFDCAAADKTTCQGRLTGRIAATSSGRWRYRVHEIVVPLRNLLWNAH